jgi:hypothetical protein
MREVLNNLLELIPQIVVYSEYLSKAYFSKRAFEICSISQK